jgi:uncharacterized protein YjcR
LNEVRAPNYELAEIDYMDGMKYKDIAKKYDVTLNTVKSWKTRHKWSRDNKNGVHTKSEKVCTQKGGQPGNKNAVGNKGGAAPEGNKNAEKHGFFAKWLPEETMEIMGAIQEKDPLDLLWDNIQLQYTAIIRSQKLMYVRDQEDKTTTKIGEGCSDTGSSEKWEVQQAWDKHATFLQAQSRAMKTLESMIKQYDSMVNNDSSKASEEQRLRIAKLKYEVSQLSGGNEGDTGIKDFLKAIKPSEEDLKELFADEEVIEDGEETTEE